MHHWLKTDCSVSGRENLRLELRLPTPLPVEPTMGAASLYFCSDSQPPYVPTHFCPFPSVSPSTANGQSFILIRSSLRSGLGAPERERTMPSRDKCCGVRSGETWSLSAAISDVGGMVAVRRAGWGWGGGYWCGRTWQTPDCSAPVRARLPISLMTSPFLTLFKFKSYMDLCGTMWQSVITPNYSAFVPPKENLSLPSEQRSVWGRTSPGVMGTGRESQSAWTSPPQCLTFASMSISYVYKTNLEACGRLLALQRFTWWEVRPLMGGWAG